MLTGWDALTQTHTGSTTRLSDGTRFQATWTETARTETPGRCGVRALREIQIEQRSLPAAGGLRLASLRDDNLSRSQSGGPKAAATYEDACDVSARPRRYEPGRTCFSYSLLEFIEAVEGGHFVGFG
jgi:hypothetical protein